MITQLFDGEAGTAQSDVIAIQSLGIGRDEASIQIDITGAATVIVRGRLSVNAGWQDLKTITASELNPMYRVPYIQLEITSNSGSVSAFIAT